MESAPRNTRDFPNNFTRLRCRAVLGDYTMPPVAPCCSRAILPSRGRPCGSSRPASTPFLMIGACRPRYAPAPERCRGIPDPSRPRTRAPWGPWSSPCRQSRTSSLRGRNPLQSFPRIHDGMILLFENFAARLPVRGSRRAVGRRYDTRAFEATEEERQIRSRDALVAVQIRSLATAGYDRGGHILREAGLQLAEV